MILLKKLLILTYIKILYIYIKLYLNKEKRLIISIKNFNNNNKNKDSKYENDYILDNQKEIIILFPLII